MRLNRTKVLPDVLVFLQIGIKTISICAQMILVMPVNVARPNVVISSAAATVVQQTMDYLRSLTPINVVMVMTAALVQILAVGPPVKRTSRELAQTVNVSGNPNVKIKMIVIITAARQIQAVLNILRANATQPKSFLGSVT